MLDLAILSPRNLQLDFYSGTTSPKDGVLSMNEIVAACKGGKKVVLS